jgi:hypothetical protein
VNAANQSRRGGRNSGAGILDTRHGLNRVGGAAQNVREGSRGA